MKAANAAHCEPPLDIEEVERIAASIARYPATTSADQDDRPFELGDAVEIAARTRDTLEREGIMIFENGEFYRYDAPTGLWLAVPDAAAREAVDTFSGWSVLGGQNSDGSPKVRPLKVSASLRTGVLEVLRDHLIYRDEAGRVASFFASATPGLAFANGFVVVDEGGVRLVPHAPEHAATTGFPFDFRPGAPPRLLLEALRACFRDDPDREAKIGLLREWHGGALIGVATRFQKALILLGGGANGKSTIAEVVIAAFPRHAVSHVTPQDMDSEYRRAAIATARLNCVADMPKNDVLTTGRIKAMISGDRMDARRIKQDPFDFRPRAAHLFTANELPPVRDTSRGFWRRWLVLEFEREFAEHEQDAGLAARIIESDLPDVVSWALEGAVNLLRRGRFVALPSCDAAVARWRREADSVATFIEERCTNGGWTPALQLFEAYRNWGQRGGYRPVGEARFWKRLKAAGLERRRTREGSSYPVTVRVTV